METDLKPQLLGWQVRVTEPMPKLFACGQRMRLVIAPAGTRRYSTACAIQLSPRGGGSGGGGRGEGADAARRVRLSESTRGRQRDIRVERQRGC